MEKRGLVHNGKSQEERFFEKILDYALDHKELGVPVPWKKIIGEAHICMVREKLLSNKKNNDEGEVIFCMELDFWERLQLLFTGKLWCCLLTFKGKLQPSRFSVYKKDFFPDSE